MTNQGVKWLVVTDLDGTMLDHESYEFEQAKEVINILQNENIPVVLNTSKTYAETLVLRKEMNVTDPFIVENGSCIYLPTSDFDQPENARQRDNYWEIVLGVSRQGIDDVLDKMGITEKDCIRLSQCSVDSAIELTGLNRQQAEDAIARDFSEPLIWKAGEAAYDKFQKKIQFFDLQLLRGGRFVHVIGQCNKGEATKHLVECYTGTPGIIALGDSENDAAMLINADVSIVVNSPSNHQLQELVTPDIQTELSAPEGWGEGVKAALKLI